MEAMRLRPDLVEGRLRLGVALRRQGKIGESEEEFRTAVGAAPDNPGAHFNLGLALKEKQERRCGASAVRGCLPPET